MAQGQIADILSQGLCKAAVCREPKEAAWAMRHSFDRILQMNTDSKPERKCQQGANGKNSSREWMLVNFQEGLSGSPRWNPINDTVMGGRSSCSMEFNASKQAAVFSGVLSTANNGGFASVRAGPTNWQTHGASGLRVLVQGDGRRYKISAKTNDAVDSVVYQQDFFAPNGPNWTQIDLPFSNFKANWRAQMDLYFVARIKVRKLHRRVMVGMQAAPQRENTFHIVRSVALWHATGIASPRKCMMTLSHHTNV
mmetsp:Transcript_840/g.1550  ORF Transcript_840/g.1550 Transcript_840/m.1550 type:complete len:253 (-) Transcript_840:285-1043(-)